MALINCKECSNEVSDKAKFCPKCGNPDLSIDTAPAPTPPTLSSSEEATEMKYKECPHCSKEIYIAATRCKHCKKDISESSDSPEDISMKQMKAIGGVILAACLIFIVYGAIDLNSGSSPKRSSESDRIDDIEFKIRALQLTLERERSELNEQLRKGLNTKAKTTLEFIKLKQAEQDKLLQELETLSP